MTYTYNEVPPRLRWLARKAHATPEEVIASAIARHSTYDAAAEDLGIHPKTLKRWREEFLNADS